MGAPPPKSQDEADAQLEKLVDERGLSERKLCGFMNGFIHSSLTLISTQLYSSDTHFILELIQNADDNEYKKCSSAGMPPGFSMSLRKSDPGANGKDTFETSCNEDGFSFQQIASLTNIGDSTKTKRKDVHSGYIGEKGIGFKAVFKVAHVVNISSGFYNFMLDTTQGMIGMLRPLPSSFPVSTYSADSTRMMLQLKSEKEFNGISSDLRRIKPEILLFLRRLRRLSVCTQRHNREYVATHNEDDREFLGETRTIHACESATGESRAIKYIITRNRVEGMPKEGKREGVATSEVTIAFPLGINGKPRIKEQQVFAFIPVNCYGFRVTS